MPCCLLILILLFPRVALALLFLFTRYLTGPFHHNLLFLILGFIFLPLTTLLYAWMFHQGMPVEGINLRAASFLTAAHAVHGVTHLAALCRLLAEREPHAAVHVALEHILDALEDPHAVAPMIARFELSFLAELGFGLDLSSCAATGAKDDLIYVSPRSGRAVSRTGGEAYQDKLLRLPAFLRGADESPSAADLADAFALTGLFLERHAFAPRGLPVPEARAYFVTALSRLVQ